MAGTVQLSTSWQAPAPDQLNITNCDTIVDYYADSISIVNEGSFLDNSKLGDMGIALAFLNSMVPKNWPGSNPRTHYEHLNYDQNLMMWYIRVWNNETCLSMPEYKSATEKIKGLARGCNLALCNKLKVKGDPDISGRGMMATYYLAAGLTTIYFIVLTLERFNLVRGPLSRIPGLSRTVTAFKSSINEFLDTSLIFAAAMLGATIARYATYRKNQEALDADDVWTYPLLGSAFIAVFSIFPCLTLQTVADFSQWRFLRLVIWCTIVALAITVEALFKPTFDDFFQKIRTYPSDEILFQPGIIRAIIWETTCGAKSQTQMLRYLVRVGLIIQAINLVWFAYTITLGLMVACLRRWHEPEAPSRILNHYDSPSTTWKWISSVLRTLVGAMCMGMMWVYLMYFVSYRGYVKSRAPSSDRDSDWSFGQVLALAQWVPTILSFIFAWKMGEKKATEEKLPQGYEALKTLEVDKYITIRDREPHEMQNIHR